MGGRDRTSLEAAKSGKMDVSDSEHLRQRKEIGHLGGSWTPGQPPVPCTRLVYLPHEQVANTESACSGWGIGVESEGERCACSTRWLARCPALTEPPADLPDHRDSSISLMPGNSRSASGRAGPFLSRFCTAFGLVVPPCHKRQRRRRHVVD